MEHTSKTFLGPSSNGRRPLWVWGPVKELGGRDSFILSLVLMAKVEESFPLILSCLQLYFKVTLACDDDAHKVIFNI